MNVTVKGITARYIPDYTPTSKDWKVHLKDAFRIVRLAGNDCFVKRFESRPSAWDFLQANRGQPHTGLPLIYDAQSIVEGGKAVYYLFLEKIEGDILHEILRTGGKANGPQLGISMAAAFRILHAQGYWHADFCAKNIMVATGGNRFVLIDLDSLEPVGTLPSATPNQPGYIPDQELAVYALSYVQAYVTPATKSFAGIVGPSLNMLQLVFLLDKLVYFAVVLKPLNTKFAQKKAYQDLPALINRHLGDYTNQIVKKILSNHSVNDEMLLSQGRNFQTQLQAAPIVSIVGTTSIAKPSITKTATRKQVTTQTVAPSAIAPAASIDYLRASETVLHPGESTVISWATNNTTTVTISYLNKVAASGWATLTYEQLVQFTGKKEGAICLLLSVSNPTQTSSVFIRLQPHVNKIILFQVGTTVLRPKESTTLSWQTNAISSVKLTPFTHVPPSGSRIVSYEQLAILSRGNTNNVELELWVGVQPSQSQKIVVNLKPFAEIRLFEASQLNTYSRNKYESTFEIQWFVSSADHVEISNIGPVRNIDWVFISRPYTDGKIEYTLTAGTPIVTKKIVIDFGKKLVIRGGSTVAVSRPRLYFLLARWHGQTNDWWRGLGFFKKAGFFIIFLLLITLGFYVKESIQQALFVPNLQKGLVFYDTQRYDSSFVNLSPFKTDTTHKYAVQYNLAKMYQYGWGTARNDNASFKLFAESRKSRNTTVATNATLELAMCFLIGRGCAQNPDSARALYQFAASQYRNEQARNQLKRLSGVTIYNRPAINPDTYIPDPPLPYPKMLPPEEEEPLCYFPSVEFQTSQHLIIRSIKQGESSTDVEFLYLSKAPNNGFYLAGYGEPNAMFIECNSAKYSLIQTFEVSNNAKNLTLVDAGTPLKFQARFQKIPSTPQKINIIEGNNSGKEGWHFFGVLTDFRLPNTNR